MNTAIDGLFLLQRAVGREQRPGLMDRSTLSQTFS
jgi:hypothetical protein